MSPTSEIPVLPPAVVADLARTGDWISSWVSVAVAGLLAVALLAVVIARRRRAAPGGRRPRRWPWVVPAGLAGVVALALAANTWVGYFPTTTALGMWAADNLGLGEARHVSTRELGGEAGGGVDAVRIPIPADVSMPEATTWIYTPPGYDEAAGPDGQEQDYPVLYLAHGSPGASTDWFTAGDAAHVLDVLIDAGEIPPLIAVSFDTNGIGAGAGDTGCLDSTTGGAQVSTFLGDVVVPFVEKTYAASDVRLIGGFSAGAFCALDQGLRAPERYAGIVAIAPYLDAGATGRQILATGAEWDEHDITAYAPSLPIAHQAVALVLTDDDDGPAHTRAVTDLAEVLRGRGRDVLAYQVDGDHTWATARAVFPAALVYVTRHLQGTGGEEAR